MGTERSDVAYGYWREASEKFDYFVAGIALALVGYLGSTIETVRLDASPDGIQALAAVVLLGAAVAGLKRIETTVTLSQITHRRLYAEESAGSLTDAAMQGAPMVNTATGEIMNPDQALRLAQIHKEGKKIVEAAIDEESARAKRWYGIRNILLIGGLALLLASRILPAYV